MKTFIKIACIAIGLSHCSGSGNANKPEPAANEKNITKEVFTGLSGTVASPSGSQTEWSGSMVYLASTKGYGRVGTIDEQGNFKIPNLDKSLSYSMFLLSRDFITQASLFNMEGSEKQIYFQLVTDAISRITISGKDMTLSSKTNVKFMANNLVTDKKDFESFKSTHQFGTYVDFFGVQLQKVILADGVKYYATFNARTADASELSNLALTIVGPDQILSGAQFESITDGNLTPWSQNSLYDDGLHNDGSANDKLWGAKVLLKSANLPAANQVVFLHVEGVNKKSEKVAAEYPFLFVGETFTDVSVKASTVSNSVRKIEFSGGPFSTAANFRWAASVMDGKNKVYESDFLDQGKRAMDFDLKTYTDPAKYKISVSFISDDVFPGFPRFNLKVKDSNL